MVTENCEQDPFHQLHDGLNKLRLQNDEIQEKNVDLVTKNVELQAMLAAKCTEGHNSNLEARMEKLEAQNVDLLTKNTELQATLVTLTKDFLTKNTQLQATVATLTNDLQSIHTIMKEGQQFVIYPTKLDNFEHTVGFLSEVRRFIRLHPTRYPDDASQIGLLLSLLSGLPLTIVVNLLEAKRTLLVLKMVVPECFSFVTEIIEVIAGKGKKLSWINQKENESPGEFLATIKLLEPFLTFCGVCEKRPSNSSWSKNLSVAGAFYHGLKPEFQKFTMMRGSLDHNLNDLRNYL
ncbi:hypothetical protein DFS34DRAFT_683430 [Phlyctochytrium arcticum]|nr:hypothetical protein DFS34DRAFT_683430 [Phlyctochytrium arcticum]